MSQINSNIELNRAIAAHRSGRVAEATGIYQTILKRSPNNARVLGLLGAAQNSLGRVSEGRRNLERATKLAPTVGQFHHDLALTYKREGNFERAHQCIDRAIKLDPTAAAHRTAKGELHFMTGDIDAAMAAIEPALRATPVPYSAALLFGLMASRLKRQQEAVDMLRDVLERKDIPAGPRMKAYFTLGAVLDSSDRFDEAFETYARGNALHPATFDPRLQQRIVDAAISAWHPDAIAALPTARTDASRMIFVVGMPRSGTSLVEQIIASSPDAHGAGELGDVLRIAREVEGGVPMGVPIVTRTANLTQQAVDKAGSAYMRMIKDLRVGDRRVVDKMPLNSLNLGLIQHALPGAKVILCRRDPVDTCLSCWFQLFDGNLSFAYDLHSCGAFHREHDRLVDHWTKVLSLPILEMQYETLVNDLEGEARRIYEFVGLPWTDAALRFHETKRTTLTSSNTQVRQPIYNRSVGRHRHYDRHLAPLREGLGLAPEST